MKHALSQCCLKTRNPISYVTLKNTSRQSPLKNFFLKIVKSTRQPKNKKRHFAGRLHLAYRVHDQTGTLHFRFIHRGALPGTAAACWLHNDEAAAVGAKWGWAKHIRRGTHRGEFTQTLLPTQHDMCDRLQTQASASAGRLSFLLSH